MKKIINFSCLVLIVGFCFMTGLYCNEAKKNSTLINEIYRLENLPDSVITQIDTVFTPVYVEVTAKPDTIYRERENFQIVTESTFNYVDSVSGWTLHIKAFGPCQVDSFQFRSLIKRPTIYSNTREIFRNNPPPTEPNNRFRKPFNVSLGIVTGKTFLGPRASFIMPNGHIGVSYDPITGRGLVDAGFNILN